MIVFFEKFTASLLKTVFALSVLILGAELNADNSRVYWYLTDTTGEVISKDIYKSVDPVTGAASLTVQCMVIKLRNSNHVLVAHVFHGNVLLESFVSSEAPVVISSAPKLKTHEVLRFSLAGILGLNGESISKDLSLVVSETENGKLILKQISRGTRQSPVFNDNF